VPQTNNVATIAPALAMPPFPNLRRSNCGTLLNLRTLKNLRVSLTNAPQAHYNIFHNLGAMHIMASQPPWWATLLLGYILGLLGNPVKKYISESVNVLRAKRDLYDDLGAYLARVEGFKLLDQPDYILWMEITRPKAPYFDYYTAKESATLLRTDRTHGIRNLVSMLRALGDAYRPETAPPEPPDEFRLRTFSHDVIIRYRQLLNAKDLHRRRLRRAYNRHREPISKDAPSLI
jgi:hypothetical protein